MTLFDVKAQSAGIVVGIGGDMQTHRRLVDMGLLGCEYGVRAKRKQSMLVEFRREFSLVVTSSVAREIEVKQSENSAVRQSERRENHAF